MMTPKTQYAKSSQGHVAYQTLGEGPLDIVFITDHPTNVEIIWEEPSFARFLTQLSSVGRLICFDRRGTGVSDPVPLGALPTLEEWTDDIRTVMDAAGARRVALFGHGQGGAMAMFFAAMYPDRTSALVLVDSCARFRQAADYEIGFSPELAAKHFDLMLRSWGTGRIADLASPSLADDVSHTQWVGRYERLSISPGELEAMYPPVVLDLDVRSVLGAIRVPTLILHRAGNRYIEVRHGRYLAEHIDGACYVELPGEDHYVYAGDSDALVAAVHEFLTGRSELPDDDRILTTVLFTDIVGSTERVTALGDRAWRDLLERHHDAVRREIHRHRGQEIDTAGDGFFAMFDGPARAVRCALAIRDSVKTLGLKIRAGLHTGECERVGDKVGGIAVHIGARVAGAAAPGEVLVSRTVKDLVAGSGLRFLDRGAHVLKGISGEWQLFLAQP
jgi:class 3 adenylate cyclase